MNPAVIVGAIAAFLGFAIGGGAVHLYYAPRLELAHERVRELGDDVRMQNRAVEALRVQGEKRAATAAKVIAAAASAARTAEQRAADMMATPAPAGDDCQALDSLLVKGLGR